MLSSVRAKLNMTELDPAGNVCVSEIPAAEIVISLALLGPVGERIYLIMNAVQITSRM